MFSFQRKEIARHSEYIPFSPRDWKITLYRTSLVVQWPRICLPMQGTWVWSLVWEDPSCLRATKPCTTATEACLPRTQALQQEKPLQWVTCPLRPEPHSPQLEKAMHRNWKSRAAKSWIKKKNRGKVAKLLKQTLIRPKQWAQMWGHKMIRKWRS